MAILSSSLPAAPLRVPITLIARDHKIRLRPTCARSHNEATENRWVIGSPRQSDRWTILQTLLRESLNPLSADLKNFAVARAPNDDLAAFGQIKPLDADTLELSSLVVLPAYRGRGLGRAVVAELLRRAEGRPVFLITVRKRRQFYVRCGFVEVIDGEENTSARVPLALRLEKLVGTPIAALAAGDGLIVMQHGAD